MWRFILLGFVLAGSAGLALWSVRAPASISPKAPQATPADKQSEALKVPNLPLRLRKKSDLSEQTSKPPNTRRQDLSLTLAYDNDTPSESSVRSTMLREVVEGLVARNIGAGEIVELTCRSLTCRLQLRSPNSEALTTLVGALQDERGFLRRAETMMLSLQDRGLQDRGLQDQGLQDQGITIYLGFARRIK